MSVGTNDQLLANAINPTVDCTGGHKSVEIVGIDQLLKPVGQWAPMDDGMLGYGSGQKYLKEE